MRDATIRGRVIKLIGNHMPGGSAVLPSIPLAQVPIHVFRGKLRPFKFFRERPALTWALTTHTHDDGGYELSISTGIYTVVAEINGELYLNSYSADGYWYHLNVKNGDMLRHNIVDSSAATF